MPPLICHQIDQAFLWLFQSALTNLEGQAYELGSFCERATGNLTSSIFVDTNLRVVA